MNKNLVLLCALIFMGTSCADFSAYRYTQIYAIVSPSENNSLRHEDDKLAFAFEIREKKIKVRITNKTEKDINLLWSKTEMVDSNGVKHVTANNETLFTDEMKNTKDAILPSGSTQNNLIVSVDNIIKMEEQWAWKIKPLFNIMDETALSNKNKTFIINFPVKFGSDAERIYRFKFIVVSVLPHRSFNPR